MLYPDLDQSLITKVIDSINSLNIVELVTPTNLLDVKEEWLRRAKLSTMCGNVRFENPEFEYDKHKLWAASEQKIFLSQAKEDLLGSRHVVPETDLDKCLLSLIAERINEAIVTAEIAANIYCGEDANTAKLVREKYGFPNSNEVVIAYRIAEGTEPLDFMSVGMRPRFDEERVADLKKLELDADDIKCWFELALSRYYIEGWRVDVSPEYSAIDTRSRGSAGKVIGIPSNRRVNGLKLIELISHELECHLRSEENARSLFEDLLADSPLLPFASILAKSDDEMLYEGYAKINDISISGAEAFPQPYYVIAMDQARRGDNFSNVAKTIYGLRVPHHRPINWTAHSRIIDQTWTTVYRVFRGCTNTEKPKHYAFPKDYAYLFGYQMALNEPIGHLDFSTLTREDIALLERSGAMPCSPKHRKLDISDWIAHNLLL